MLGFEQQKIQAGLKNFNSELPIAQQILLMAAAGATLVKERFNPTRTPKLIAVKSIKEKNTGNEL